MNDKERAERWKELVDKSQSIIDRQFKQINTCMDMLVFYLAELQMHYEKYGYDTEIKDRIKIAKMERQFKEKE